MSDTNCLDCSKRSKGGCEKHPSKICMIQGCDKQCGYQVHGSIKRKRLVLPRINFLTAPKKDIKNGLLILWDTETPESTSLSLADIEKGMREYDLPNDPRNIKGIYMKIR